MDALTKALSLYEIGCWVFPARLTAEGTKVPLTGNGHLDASNDPEQIAGWFQGKHKNDLVAVHAGRSGLVLLDRDIKRDEDGNETKNGFKSLEENWFLAPDTFAYTSIRGEGKHDVYLSPENVVLNGQADYRKMLGVDRRGGSSWWVWAADEVPDSRDAFSLAPDWLCDPAEVRTGAEFLGGLDEWLDGLIQGEPNVLVKKAIERIPADMSHSDMVERQLNAIRLGAEGAPGVKLLLDKILEAWMTREESNHTTPKDAWHYKFDEALSRGIQLYGDQVLRIKDLPDFNIKSLPEGLSAGLLTGEPQDKYHFSKVLNELARLDVDDDTRASILWNAPTTKTIAHEWGIDFVYERVEKSHVAPEPIRENPALESKPVVRKGYVRLLSDAEEDYIAKRPTFVDRYMAAAKEAGIDNEVYTRSGAWNVSSMAFAFRGFIPQGPDKNMGVNLWTITTGYSGTGKSTNYDFEEVCLNALFTGDNEDKSPYVTGGDTSPQGLHAHLLERDRKATVLRQDEASRFFKSIQSKNWIEELTDATSDWYGGRVGASSKINLKELRGKTALTSFHLAMMATPDRLLALIDDGMFESGFLARVLWSVAEPPSEEDEDRRYQKRQYEGSPEDSFDQASPIVRDLVSDLVSAARLVGNKPKRILANDESLSRMFQAHKKMGQTIKGHLKWSILDPSVTRLGEDTMRKCAAICAMYRGDSRIRIDDTLHAIKAVEIWFNYLLQVVDEIAQGDFQKLCNDLEFFIRKERTVSETKVLDSFRNRIIRDPREIDTAIRFLVSSGRINKVEEKAGQAPKYAINGGK